MSKFSPAQFIREVRNELKKTVWPTKKETLMTALMVFVLVSIVGVFLFGVDALFTYLLKLIIG